MDPSDVIRLLRDVHEAITRISQRSGALQEAADDLAAVIQDLEPYLARAIAGARGSPGSNSALPPALAKLRVALASILREPENHISTQWVKGHPDVTANAIHIKRKADGSAIVSIDGRKLAVPPALGDLVSELIVDDGGFSPDDLIPFKPLPVLALKLEQLKGRPFSIHTLNQQIHRLRRYLQDHDFPQLLVQTNRSAGVRLALRRQGPAEAAPSPLEKI
jgi:hypothetical protein